MLRAALVVFVLCSATSVLAHHSFVATFDPSKPIEVTAVITKTGFANPHSIFWADVKRPDGKVESWAFEGGGPALFRSARELMQPGATIKIKAYRARDGGRFAAVSTLTLSDGRTIVGGVTPSTPNAGRK